MSASNSQVLYMFFGDSFLRHRLLKEESALAEFITQAHLKNNYRLTNL